MSKHLTCAVCQHVLDDDDDVYMCRDNFLQVKFFDEPDCSDNVFCSPECALRALSVELVQRTDVPASAWMEDDDAD